MTPIRQAIRTSYGCNAALLEADNVVAVEALAVIRRAWTTILWNRKAANCDLIIVRAVLTAAGAWLEGDVDDAL
jgi:hypothetical protein